MTTRRAAGLPAARSVAARVASNRCLVPGIFRIALRLPPDWGPAMPGQFVQLDCPPPELFGLRRPFSLAGCRRVRGGVEAQIVYGVVGMRTAALAALRPGAVLPLVGPLGRPFVPVPGRRSVLVGGGRGVAPLLMLAEHLGRGEPEDEPLLLHGARTAAELIPIPDPPCPVRLATEDGSAGFRGTVVDLLHCMLDRGELREGRDAIFACGPNPMLAAIAGRSAGRDLPCQVSLETHFGCGLGICAGCAIPARFAPGSEDAAFGRYLFLCREGPVLDAGRVDWGEVRG